MLIAGSSVALAKSDYPEDFTPQIVYQDKAYISEHGGSESNKPASSSSATKSTSSGSSSKYPADFEPVILYQDKAYISKSGGSKSTTARKSSTASRTSNPSSTPSTSRSSANESAESAPSESGMSQYLIGLVVLIAAGAFLFNKRPASESSQDSNAPAPTVANGSTGVANYLRKNQMAEPTGVAKYLDQQTIENATGVEKYLSNQS